jgi:hypothetical protein
MAYSERDSLRDANPLSFLETDQRNRRPACRTGTDPGWLCAFKFRRYLPTQFQRCSAGEGQGVHHLLASAPQRSRQEARCGLFRCLPSPILPSLAISSRGFDLRFVSGAGLMNAPSQKKNGRPRESPLGRTHQNAQLKITSIRVADIFRSSVRPGSCSRSAGPARHRRGASRTAR